MVDSSRVCGCSRTKGRCWSGRLVVNDGRMKRIALSSESEGGRANRRGEGDRAMTRRDASVTLTVRGCRERPAVASRRFRVRGGGSNGKMMKAMRL